MVVNFDGLGQLMFILSATDNEILSTLSNSFMVSWGSLFSQLDGVVPWCVEGVDCRVDR